MATPRLQKKVKFPTYVLSPSDEKAACALTNSDEDVCLKNLFTVDQIAQEREALKYAEEFLVKDIRVLTADQLREFVKELHRQCARSLVLLNNQAEAGNYSNARVYMRQETGRADLEYEQGFPFSQKNYNILKQIHGDQVAESYKAFCGELQEVIKTKGVRIDFYDLVLNTGLDKHPGYKAYSLIDKFGEKPEKFDELMHLFCETLVSKIKASDPDLIDCASYALFGLCKFHFFPNGNGRTARILMNCILMSFGVNLIRIDRDINKKDYYLAMESSTFENLEPLKAFIEANIKISYSEDENDDLFPDNGVNFYLNWGDGGHKCFVFQDCYEVVSKGNFENYTSIINENTSQAPVFIVQAQNALKAKCVDFRIDGPFCESKGNLYERNNNLVCAMYYLQRASDFYAKSNMSEKAKHCFERSKKLRLKLRHPNPVGTSVEEKVPLDQKANMAGFFGERPKAEDVKLLAKKALNHYKKNEWAFAIQAYEKLMHHWDMKVKHNPYSVELIKHLLTCLYNLGSAKMKYGDFNGALEILKKAVHNSKVIAQFENQPVDIKYAQRYQECQQLLATNTPLAAVATMINDESDRPAKRQRV